MTKIINFDNLKKEPAVVLVIDGVRHEMQTATVETFIENMSAIEGLGLNSSPIKELEVIVGIVNRAFPSLKEKQIRGWSIDTIQHLSDIARGINGEVASTDEEKIKEANATGNPPKAN